VKWMRNEIRHVECNSNNIVLFNDIFICDLSPKLRIERTHPLFGETTFPSFITFPTEIYDDSFVDEKNTILKYVDCIHFIFASFGRVTPVVIIILNPKPYFFSHILRFFTSTSYQHPHNHTNQHHHISTSSQSHISTPSQLHIHIYQHPHNHTNTITHINTITITQSYIPTSSQSHQHHHNYTIIHTNIQQVEKRCKREDS
jgi:hypothetical protein